MKSILLLSVLSILFNTCATTSKMANKAIYHALIGQNEMIIYSRLGSPTRTIPASDGEKIMIYEFYSKGMFLTPYKSKITYDAKKDLSGNRKGLIFHSGVNTVTNDPKYTIYQEVVSYIKVFMNKQGKCVRFEENLTRDQLEMCYELFKRYIPKD